MSGYVARRLLVGVMVLFGVTSLTFFLFHVSGADPAAALLGKSANAAELDRVRREYGFDRPLLEQYLQWLLGLARLDLGRSFVSREPVSAILLGALGPTLSLTFPALAFSTVLALLVALLSAAFRGGVLDRALLFFAVLGMSVSLVVYVVFGQYLLAFMVPLFEIHGYDRGVVERWPYLGLPIVILVSAGLGYDARFFRAVLAGELSRDYVTTARAKGLSGARVLGVHVLANALVPVISRVAGAVPFLVTGSLLLESFFGIPGLGGVLYQAIDRADVPVIRAYAALTSVVVVLAQLIGDVLYAVVDPRVRLAP